MDFRNDLLVAPADVDVAPSYPLADRDAAVDLQEVQRYASWLGGGLTWQYFPEGAAAHGSGAGVLHGDVSEVGDRLAELNAAGAGIFAMVNEGDGQGRSAAHVTRIRALFVDLDGTPLAPVQECGVAPHLIVESSPGRWHAYWRVDDCDFEQFKPLQQALARRFGGDTSVCDLPRVMRVPGFWHLKRQPFRTRIVQMEDRPAIPVADLIAKLGLDPTVHPAPQELSVSSPPAASARALLSQTVPEGQRHVHLVSMAGRLNGQGLSPAALRAALEHENAARCYPPLPATEVDRIAADVATRYADQNGSRVSGRPTSQGDPWPALDPLPEPVRLEPEPFPLHALGPVLGPAARSIARLVQVPDAMAAASVLASASLAAQPLADVRLPHGVVPLSLYIVTSAGSGDRKTATDNVANKVFLEIRQAQARELARLEAEYAQDMLGGQRGDRSIPRPTVAVPIIGKATIEALQRALKSQSSIGVFTSEGGEFVGGHSMREDRRASGLAWYLTAWDGGDLTDMTVTHGTSMVVGRRVAMHVLLQPVLLAKLLSDPLAAQQGLLPRMLISEPRSLAGSRLYKPEDVSHDPAVRGYYAAIRNLAERPLPTVGGGDPHELMPRELIIGVAALESWTDFFNETEQAQAEGGPLEKVRPFASKVAEHAARVAGVLALVRDPDTYEVDESNMAGAIDIARFFLAEHVRLTGSSIENARLDRLRTLADWLMTRRPPVAMKEILQHSPRAVRDLKATGLHPLLEELQSRGYVRRVTEGWEVRR